MDVVSSRGAFSPAFCSKGPEDRWPYGEIMKIPLSRVSIAGSFSAVGSR